LKYIKGEKNVVADALSRLDMIEEKIHNVAECFGYDDDNLPSDTFPICYRDIAHAQSKEKCLRKKLLSLDSYSEQKFRGGNKSHTLICHNGKIAVPKQIQSHLVDWYNEMLCHPGETRTKQMICQHFDWKGLNTTVYEICSKCPTCQKAKVSNQKYGKLLAKQAEVNPRDTLCVDLIGPYTIQRKGKSDLKLWCYTIIDPAMGWFEMSPITNKTAAKVADIAERAWFTRYPIPQNIVFDRGTKFMAEFSKMCREDYGLKRKPITTRNPQANTIIKFVHQTLGNIICTFNVQTMDESNQWAGILAATMFAVRATTYHTKLKASPMHLVFGQDTMLNVSHATNWGTHSSTQTRPNQR
jgi:hypothetical protein